MDTYRELTAEEQARLDKDFTYHSPFGNQPQRYTDIRNNGRSFAESILRFTPASREQSLAITKIEEAIFWANAAIARNEKEVTE